ncbi:hypothetical protein [Hominibacterium faecale]|uniref:hypothetical protein n=1 Tax=Hominibacterium faecale TaxID=2839743 RepID=UPI001D10D493|nr:hypothetical protein [Hominibacterium faecale]MCC2865480.1 hypothetical protein [Anaerovorax odorimutans]
MFIKQLDGFTAKHQVGSDSCWICTSMMIDNYYRHQDGTTQWNSETDFKTALEAADPNLAANYHKETGKVLNWNGQGSAPTILLFAGRGSNTDDHSVPDFYEIMQAIYDGIPLLSCVGTRRKSNRTPKLSVPNGHWIVIIGARCAQDPGSRPSDDSSMGDPGQFELIVADPDDADGNLQIIPYNSLVYQRNGITAQYWENTSYVDKTV